MSNEMNLIFLDINSVYSINDENKDENNNNKINDNNIFDNNNLSDNNNNDINNIQNKEINNNNNNDINNTQNKEIINNNNIDNKLQINKNFIKSILEYYSKTHIITNKTDYMDKDDIPIEYKYYKFSYQIVSGVATKTKFYYIKDFDDISKELYSKCQAFLILFDLNQNNVIDKLNLSIDFFKKMAKKQKFQKEYFFIGLKNKNENINNKNEISLKFFKKKISTSEYVEGIIDEKLDKLNEYIEFVIKKVYKDKEKYLISNDDHTETEDEYINQDNSSSCILI